MVIHAYYAKTFPEFEQIMHPFRHASSFPLPGAGCIISFPEASRADALALSQIDGMTVFPPHSSPKLLSDDHVSKLGYAGIKKGDKMQDALDKLAAHHGAPWFNTETYY